MKIAKYRGGDGRIRVGIVRDDQVAGLRVSAASDSAASDHLLTDLLDADDCLAAIKSYETEAAVPIDQVELLPPIDQQEIWAAGVTYKRSQTARMEESEASASCYDRVYGAERPELFFKATPQRTRGHGQPLRIRRDSKWNVPEPEVALVLNRKLRIVGLTIGNDMSSRDIEGENPLYLPQAKCYDASAGLGPWIRILDKKPNRAELGIQLQIVRDGATVFDASTSAAEMAREFEDLVQWLGRDNVFPHGAVLMTGTGVVPDSDFTLLPGDEVAITIDTIGTLRNSIFQD
jgi:2-dehydro-3-deoxy-D-arabinonate dehydratase